MHKSMIQWSRRSRTPPLHSWSSLRRATCRWQRTVTRATQRDRSAATRLTVGKMFRFCTTLRRPWYNIIILPSPCSVNRLRPQWDGYYAKTTTLTAVSTDTPYAKKKFFHQFLVQYPNLKWNFYLFYYLSIILRPSRRDEKNVGHANCTNSNAKNDFKSFATQLPLYVAIIHIILQYYA